MADFLLSQSSNNTATHFLFAGEKGKIEAPLGAAYQVLKQATDAATQVMEMEQVQGPLATAISIGLALFVLAVIYDQYSYRRQKGPLAGADWKVPFVGHLFKSLDPNFPEWLKTMDLGISCVSVLHRFVVIIPSTDVVRKVLSAGDKTKLAGCDALETYLSPGNFIFMDGKPHVEFRKGLNALFTKQALARYLPVMEAAYDLHFKKFLDITQGNKGQPAQFMKPFQDMLCCVSCRTFCGEHIAEDMVEKIAADFWLITAALELVNFPIALPYTKAWYGKKATQMVLAEFTRCAGRSMRKMKAGGEITCVLDAWIRQMLDSEAWRQREATEKNLDQSEKPVGHLIRMFSDKEIGESLLVFLFAAQDASTSAVTWLFQYVADRPEWREAIREEQLKLRDGDRTKPVTTDMIDAMQVTRACTKETLRSRPPPIMLARKVRKEFSVTDNFIARKGQMLMTSLWSPLHDPEAYPDPDTWRPERWITGDADKQTKNWLAFGTGPHSCLGQTYAQMNLAALIGRATMFMDWTHHQTSESGEIKIFATIYPKDDCHLVFSEIDGGRAELDRDAKVLGITTV